MRRLHLLRTGKKDDLLEISPITDSLFISGWPAGRHAPQIAELGITLIISMIREKQDIELTQTPFQNLQLNTTDFVLMPMSTDKLRQGVEAALPVIEGGGKVLTYCKSGIHRSAAMATCILIGQGYTLDEATHLVKDGRAAAKPDTPHIHKQIEKFAAEWPSK
jgi:protein-tyrosine phosphatase